MLLIQTVHEHPNLGNTELSKVKISLFWNLPQAFNILMHKKNKIQCFSNFFFACRIPFATVEHLKSIDSSRAALLKIYYARESARGLIKKHIPTQEVWCGAKDSAFSMNSQWTLILLICTPDLENQDSKGISPDI